ALPIISCIGSDKNNDFFCIAFGSEKKKQPSYQNRKNDDSKQFNIIKSSVSTSCHFYLFKLLQSYYIFTCPDGQQFKTFGVIFENRPCKRKALQKKRKNIEKEINDYKKW